jgi:protein ImuA
MDTAKQEIISKLRQDILTWEGFRAPEAGENTEFGLGPLQSAFPNQIFPTGVLHEFISSRPEDTSAAGGFIAGLMQVLLSDGGACLWISYTRRIYPPALRRYDVDPERIIFVDVRREKDVLWVTEEALKCEGIALVVCETKGLTFMESRRLQLAIEKSGVTGFVLRKDIKTTNTTACTARWTVKPVRSQLRPGMPGVGHPRWRVELLKVKNGQPGAWTIEWKKKRFENIVEQASMHQQQLYA